MSRPFDIVPIGQFPAADLVDVVNRAFGRHESVEWFRWKHLEGPWGPSIGAVAIDHVGPIGLRLLLPWGFRLGDDMLLGHRATEAATIPRAQGQGVFTALNAWMMNQVETDLIFSTPNEKSRGGYMKLGWEVIARVPHRWEVALRVETPEAADIRPREALRTDWDRQALVWRSDPRCRHRYSEATDSGRGSSVFYRMVSGRWPRTVAPLGVAGTRAGIADAWNRMLRDTRARIVLRPSSQPTPSRSQRAGWTRGVSLVVGWIPPGSRLAGGGQRSLQQAPWTAADLEGVI